ncbi:MAG: aminotransferase class III-fold pyridoxal phosphate-dependent enzyme [Rikenellaceae bacterium]
MKNFEVYKLWPIEPVRARGCKVWDKDDVEYLDFYGGHAVISIGHGHPVYNKMINEQMEKICFYSNSIVNSLQEELADRLGRVSGYSDYSLFLCNSGAEANENALKLASFNNGKKRIIAFEGAFHGRTSGAVAVTDNKKIMSPFSSGHEVTFVKLNDIKTVEQEISKEDCAAVIIEGIQGVAGIYIPAEEFLRELRKITLKYGVALILDEVQSGYGRSGKFFAHQYSGIKPDIITTAKGMGNGFPIGGVLISPEIKAQQGMLGTTFGGNYLACTAAIAVLKVIEEESLLDNAVELGKYLISELKKIKSGLSSKAITDIRGVGLIVGIEMESGFIQVRDKLLFEDKIFTGGAKLNIIRLLPPLTIEKEDIDHFIGCFNNQLTKML